MIPSWLKYRATVSFGYAGVIEPEMVSVRSRSLMFEGTADRFIDMDDELKELQQFDETCAGDVCSLFSREIMYGCSSARRGGTSPTFQSMAGVHSAIQYFLPSNS